MNIRRARVEDAPVLTAIAFAAKRHWDYPERWIACWRDLLTIPPDFIARHETHAAVMDGRIVGFYALGFSGPRLELAHLWVRPEQIRQGVGRTLFLHALARGRALGYDEMEIESDPNAEGFYRRMGARRVRVSVGQVDGERRELPVLLCPVDGATGAADTACP